LSGHHHHYMWDRTRREWGMFPLSSWHFPDVDLLHGLM
jgi:hypothetical protein